MLETSRQTTPTEYTGGLKDVSASYQGDQMVIHSVAELESGRARQGPGRNDT